MRLDAFTGARVAARVCVPLRRCPTCSPTVVPHRTVAPRSRAGRISVRARQPGRPEDGEEGEEGEGADDDDGSFVPGPGIGANCYALRMAYDGTDYAGFQVQLGSKLATIQGLLEAALVRITGEDRKTLFVAGAGRTDAGVHARGQVAHFRTNTVIGDTPRLLRSLNALLPADIRVMSAQAVPTDWHARFSCTSKRYTYSLGLESCLSPFERRYRWHVWRPLDVDALATAAADCVGRHDFSAFANRTRAEAGGACPRDPVRLMTRCAVIPEPHGVRLELESSGFLYRQVRNLVGTLVHVASHPGADPGLVRRLLATGDREAAPKSLGAPARGLFLDHVTYGPGGGRRARRKDATNDGKAAVPLLAPLLQQDTLSQAY